MIRYVVAILCLLPAAAFAADSSSGSSLSDTLQTFIDFISTGIYESADTILERVAAWYIVWHLELKMFWLQMAVSVAEGFIDGIGISGLINSALGGIDSAVSGIVFYLKIPEAINMILSARVARLILDLLS